MDDFVARFNERRAGESRAVCERIEREDAGGRVVLTGREKQILDMWPKFEDGEYVRIGDAVEVHHDGAIIIEAIEFSRGKVHVKDAEDGDWNTSMCAIRPLQRPVQSVLDADGVEIKVGDAVWHCSGTASGVVTGIDAGSLMHTTRYVDESGTEFRDAARNLTHTRPDSWERLEEDAGMYVCDYARGDVAGGEHLCKGCPYDVVDRDGMGCKQRMARDLVRRAKALAGAAE